MDDTRFDELFSGDLENLIELPKRVVRLFISSTFTDMTLERNTLMERVYPRLKKYCRERHGLDFQVVDMRWGVRDEATDDHQTASLCSREIDNCQRMSLGPNFVALVGNKYGFRPLSNRIKSSEYRALRQALIQLDINTDFLDVWYKEDTNAQPAEYLLQPISSILKNFTNKSEPDLQSIDQRLWSAIQDRLHELLLAGSRELVKQGKMMQEEQLMKYSISVTEREIIEGCLQVREAKLHCLVYVRQIIDLQRHLEDCLAKMSPVYSQQLNPIDSSGSALAGQPNDSGDGNSSRRGSGASRRDSSQRRASLKIGDDVISLQTTGAMNAGERRLERQRRLIGRYIDMRSASNNEASNQSEGVASWSLDEEAQEALALLRDKKLIVKLADQRHPVSGGDNKSSGKKGIQNLTKFRIAWDESEGISLKCDEHKQYLNELSEHFYTNLTRMIRRASKTEQHAIVSKSSSLVNEILQHSHYAKHVSCSFHGRHKELAKIKSYVLGFDRTIGSSKPMFLYGVGGSGKTSLMAKAAALAKAWILHQNTTRNGNSPSPTRNRSNDSQSTATTKPCIIVRFCCTTPASTSMLDVLRSVARQLQYQFYQFGPLSGQSQQHEQHLTRTTLISKSKQSAQDAQQDNEASFTSQLAYASLPEDFVQLVFRFRQLLDNCRHPLHKSRLFIILLDSIERLTTPAQSGVEVKYSWLTSIAKLPPNVRLIVSCSSERSSHYPSFVHLKRHFIQSHFLQLRHHQAKSTTTQRLEDKHWILHVKPLGVTLALEVVRQWLSVKGRALSAAQWAMVERCFEHCSRPIFVKLAFDEMLNWRSYSMQSESRGLTFGSSLLQSRNDAQQLVAMHSLEDPVLRSLQAACCVTTGSTPETLVNNNLEFDESDQQVRQQIVSMEQEWLNYYEHRRRAEQIRVAQPETATKEDKPSLLIKIDTMMSKSAATSGNGKQQQRQHHASGGNSAASLCHLSNTIDDAICQLFARIELQHGFILTKHSLSYLTIARNGICENELEDVLSLDDVVLNDVFQYHLPPVRRIPPLLWTRIRNDLPDYLSERDADGIVLNWHHAQFQRVTESRYLQQRQNEQDPSSSGPADATSNDNNQQLLYFHFILADYFLGRWADKAKPFRCSRHQIQMAAEQLDSTLQQSARKNSSGGSGPDQSQSGMQKWRSSQQGQASGSMGRLTGQRAGSIRAGGGSFALPQATRSSARNSDLLINTRLQSAMQAKADRRVPHQPLFYLIEEQSIQAPGDNVTAKQQDQINSEEFTTNHKQTVTKKRFNLRKLTELPYHLIRSRRFLDLAQVVLFNFNWLSASLQALGLQSLLADFEDAQRGLEAALRAVKSTSSTTATLTATPLNLTSSAIPLTMQDQLLELADQELDASELEQMISQLRKLESSIRLSCSVLHSAPQMLAPQLIGRLINITCCSDGKYRWLAQLLGQCDKFGSAECALLPIGQCFQSPDGMQSSSLEGHPFGITGMAMGADQRHLLAISNRFVMWDTSTGQILREVNPELEASLMCQVQMGFNSEFAIAYTSNDVILALDILTQQAISYKYTNSNPIQDDESQICGLNLIDRYGATRFVVWTRSSWFVMRILNNELDAAASNGSQQESAARISLELVYELDLSLIGTNNLVTSQILSVQCCPSSASTLSSQELSFVKIARGSNQVELVTLGRPSSDSSRETRIELWDRSTFDVHQIGALALDERTKKQLIWANMRGDILLSRRCAISWSRPKMLLRQFRDTDNEIEQAADDLVPLCIELESARPNENELESLLLLDDNLNRDELCEFERQVDDLSNHGDRDEDQNEDPRFDRLTRLNCEQVFKPQNDPLASKSSPVSTGVRLIKLYYGSRIVLLQLFNDSNREKIVLDFPKEVQNVSIKLGECQVKAICLGEPLEFLVAAATKKLLFFSLKSQALLRVIDEAHSARIVQLLPILQPTGTKKPPSLSVASASMDKTVKIWTLENVNKLDEPSERMPDCIEQLSILGNQPQLPLAACLARNGQLGLFNWATMRLVHPRLGFKGDREANERLELANEMRISRAQFSPDGQFLCLATRNSVHLCTYEANSLSVALGSKTSTSYSPNSASQQLRLKLHSKLCLPIDDQTQHQIVRKLKFLHQDSRILTLLERVVSSSGETTLSASPESVATSESSRSNPGSRGTGQTSGLSKLEASCHSLSDSRLVYTLQLNVWQAQGWQANKQSEQQSKKNDAKTRTRTETKTNTFNSFGARRLLEPLPVVTKDRLNLVALEVMSCNNDAKPAAASSCSKTNDVLNEDSTIPVKCLNVYSTRDGILLHWIALNKLEFVAAPSEEPPSSLISDARDENNAIWGNSMLAHKNAINTTKRARHLLDATGSSPLSSPPSSVLRRTHDNNENVTRSTINLMQFLVTKMRPIVYRDKPTIVALIDSEKSLISHLIDVNKRQLVCSSASWDGGKLSSDHRFGLTRFSNSTSIATRGGRPNFTQGTSNQKVSSFSGGLELLEMRRMTKLRCLLSSRDMENLESKTHSSNSSSSGGGGHSSGAASADSGASGAILSGFTHPNDEYVYYYDPKLKSLLLIRLRDSKLLANYKPQSGGGGGGGGGSVQVVGWQVSQIKSSPNGFAIILAQTDGSLCSLAIADCEKSDTLVRLAQYPSRRQTAAGAVSAPSR